VTLRVRVRARRAARGLVLVSGTVRGARSGRVLVTARSARRSTRAVLRLRSGGKFSKRLRMSGGRWRLRAEYRTTSRGPALATAARALRF
jgi:hypothetical protein